MYALGTQFVDNIIKRAGAHSFAFVFLRQIIISTINCLFFNTS